ncbi:hypothetical protein [Lentzea sp. NPDC004782]|uniref:hypothetical protein n=1 Tax=Lentzea sp. NPDC004782 TaxID=3154458 RepID=UPI0033A7ED50
MPTGPVDARTWVAGTRDDQVRFDDAGERGPVLAPVALAWLASGRTLRTLPARIEVTAG